MVVHLGLSNYLVPKHNTRSAILQCFSAGSISLGGKASFQRKWRSELRLKILKMNKPFLMNFTEPIKLRYKQEISATSIYTWWVKENYTSQSRTVSLSFAAQPSLEQRRVVSFSPMVSISKSLTYLHRGIMIKKQPRPSSKANILSVLNQPDTNVI